MVAICAPAQVVNTHDADMTQEMEQSLNMLNSSHKRPDVSEFMTKSLQNHPASLVVAAAKQAKVGLAKGDSCVVQSWHLHKHGKSGWHLSLEGKPCEATTTLNLSHP